MLPGWQMSSVLRWCPRTEIRVSGFCRPIFGASVERYTAERERITPVDCIASDSMPPTPHAWFRFFKILRPHQPRLHRCVFLLGGVIDCLSGQE